MDRDEVSRRAARGGVVQLAAQVVQLAFTVASGALLARLLAPADFGVAGMATILLSLATMVRDFGLPTAAIQRAADDDATRSALFWRTVRLNLRLAGGMALAAPLMGWLVGDARVAYVTVVFAAATAAHGLGAQHEALLVRELRFVSLRRVELGALALSLLAGAGLAAAGAGYWALALQQLLLGAGRSAGLWWITGWRPRPAAASRDATEALAPLARFGWHLTGARLLRHLAQSVDQFTVGLRFGAGPMGFYDNAYRWSIAAILQVFNPLQSVAVAGLSRLRDHPQAFRDAARRALLPVFGLVVPALAFLALQARPVIRVLLGDRWDPSIPLFRVLALAAVATCISRAAMWLHTAEGRVARMLRWGAVALAGTLTGVVIGAPHGPLGIATGWTVATWALLAPEVAYGLHGSHLPLRDFAALALRPLAATGLAVAASWPLTGTAASTPLAFAVALAAYGGAYLLAWLLIPGGRAAIAEIARLRRALFDRASDG